jgi:putative N6-adenine-specific DNA methylase
MAQKTLELFAIAAPGCEAACLAELEALGIQGVAELGGVSFAGDLGVLYQANLWLRSASRILVRFGQLQAKSFPELYQKCVRLPWGRYIRPQTALVVRVTSRKSRLMHSGRIAETVQAAIDRALGRTQVAEHSPAQRILIRFEQDQVLISIDSSGDLLHRRGYRLEQGVAPLRESLAAALLHELDWRPSESLWDPMCGSATLLIEAALMGMRRAPGLQRAFAFENWPHFRAGRWEVLCRQAQENEDSGTSLSLYGSELEPPLLAVARRNAERAGVSSRIRLSCGDFRHLPVPAEGGVLVCNPPYGLRIGEHRTLKTFYAEFGDFLRHRAHGWRGAMLLPDPRLVAATGLELRKGPVFSHGGLSVPLYFFPPL